jgi:hypothetical protein
MNRNNTFRRISSKGQEDTFLPAFCGGETEQELRELVLQLTLTCSAARSLPDCPIRQLKGLSNVTLRNTVNRWSPETCLELLQEECTCRNVHEGCGCRIQ